MTHSACLCWNTGYGTWGHVTCLRLRSLTTDNPNQKEQGTLPSVPMSSLGAGTSGEMSVEPLGMFFGSKPTGHFLAGGAYLGKVQL